MHPKNLSQLLKPICYVGQSDGEAGKVLGQVSSQPAAGVSRIPRKLLLFRRRPGFATRPLPQHAQVSSTMFANEIERTSNLEEKQMQPDVLRKRALSRCHAYCGVAGPRRLGDARSPQPSKLSTAKKLVRRNVDNCFLPLPRISYYMLGIGIFRPLETWGVPWAL